MEATSRDTTLLPQVTHMHFQQDFVLLDLLGLQTQGLVWITKLVSVNFSHLHAQNAHKSEKLHK